jgi:hypothetical protein
LKSQPSEKWFLGAKMFIIILPAWVERVELLVVPCR